MYWPATLVAPRAVQGYFSPTPLNVLVCEGFSACPAKSSLHLDISELERGLKDPSSEVLHAVSDALETPVHEIARRAASVLDGTARLGPTVLAIAA